MPHTEAKKLPSGFDQGGGFKYETPQAATIRDSLPSKTKKYVIVRCPKSFPVLPGTVPLKGQVNDTLMDGMRSMSSHHAPWLALISGEVSGMREFDKDVQDTIINSKDALGDLFPPRTKVESTIFASSVHTNFEAPPSTVALVDSDEELEGADSSVLNAVTAITDHMEAIVRRNTSPPSSAGPPTTVGVSTTEPPEPKDDLPTGADIARNVAKLCLFTMALPGGESVKTFDIREGVIKALNQPAKTKAEVLNNLFRASAETHAAGLDCIMRFSRWPTQYSQMPVVATIIANVMLSDKPIKDLAKVSTNATWGLTVGTFLPPNKEAISAVSEIEDEGKRRDLQVFLGEHSSKTKSVSMKMQHSSRIEDRWQIVSCCANISSTLHALCDFDITSISYDDAPHVHVEARKLALAIHSGEYTGFHENHPSRITKLNYHAFGVLDRTMVVGGMVLKEEESITAACAHKGDGTINPAHAILAKRTLEKGLGSISGVIRAAETLESTEAYKNSPFYKAKRKRHADSSDEDEGDDSDDGDRKPRASRSSKRSNNAGDDTKSGKKPKNVGAIITEKGMKYLPMPDDKDFPEGEVVLCGARLRDGTRGCQNSECKKDHRHIRKWSKPLLKFMIKHVDNTDGISWNPRVATPSILGLKYNKVP